MTSLVTVSQRKPGIGQPVLVFHGFLGDESAWDEVVAELPNPVFAVRLPGHGARAELPRAATFGDLVQRIGDQLALDVPCVLAGYSMGGRVALSFVRTFGANVTGLLLVGAHPGLVSPGDRADRRRWDLDWAERFQSGDLSAAVDAWESQPIFATQALLPDAVQDAQRRVRTSHAPEGLAWAMNTLGLGAMPAQHDLLGRVPTVLMAGGLDDKHRDLATRLAAGTPGVRAEIVPEKGHNLLLEAPRAVARALLALSAPTEAHFDVAPSPIPRTNR